MSNLPKNPKLTPMNIGDLIQLLDAGKIPCRLVGHYRRVCREDAERFEREEQESRRARCPVALLDACVLFPPVLPLRRTLQPPGRRVSVTRRG